MLGTRPALALALLLAAVAAAGCRKRPPPKPIHTGGRHFVVLIPGWMSGGAQVKPLSDAISRQVRVEVHRLELKGLGVTETLPEYAEELERFVAGLELRPQDRLDLVAFSFGGLVSRWYAEVLGARPKKPTWIVTVCTPHHGTTRGRWLRVVTTLREMQPGSEAVLRLSRSRRADIDYFSVRLSRDTAIKPHCSSVLPGAKNYELRGRTHQMAPYSRRVTATVAAIYAGTAASSGPQALSARQRAALRLPPGPAPQPKPPTSGR
jgi:triacylglycerol lipase